MHPSICRIAGLFALSVATASSAGPPDDDAHWFVRATYVDRAQLRAIAPHFQHLQIDAERRQIGVEADAAQLRVLRENGFVVEFDLDATAQMRALDDPGAQLKSIPGFGCYRTVEETVASGDALVAAHPALASVIEIGPSWERERDPLAGYALRVLKLTNSATDSATPKPKMFVMTAIHAREYTTAELNTRFAEWLVNGYGTDPRATWLLDHNEFHLLLHANPDGRKKAETGLLWRKNTDTVDANCASSPNNSGVDLNRNYPFRWNTVPGGSSGNTCQEAYRGIAAASEPETSAVVAYVQSIFPDLRVDDAVTPAPDDTQGLFFDIHSYSQAVLWPWGFDAPAPNSTALTTLGRRIAWHNDYHSEQIRDFTLTDGTTADTFYGMLGVPSYALELGVAFFENCTTFTNTTYPRNLAALQYAARTLYAPYRQPAGPDVHTIAVTPSRVVAGASVTLHATADDLRYQQRFGTQATYVIHGAGATIDMLPWTSGAASIPLQADDGAFDEKSEAMTGTIDTTGLTPGRHLVYVQATNELAGGTAGTPDAVFLDIDDPAEHIFADDFETF